MWRVLLRENVIEGQRVATHPCPRCNLFTLAPSKFRKDQLYCANRCGYSEPTPGDAYLLTTPLYWQRFWVLATNGKSHYMHFYEFGDDWDAAYALVERIKACPEFTPEGKPGVWLPIRDTREIRPKPWRRLKNWWIEWNR